MSRRRRGGTVSLDGRSYRRHGAWSPVRAFRVRHLPDHVDANHETSPRSWSPIMISSRSGASRAGLDEYAWAGVDLSEVSVAAEVSAGTPVPVPLESRVLHVFLPTAEACPYPILINGAFSADLSRQEVRVTTDPDDYNRWLLTCASNVFCDQLVPALYDLGASELALIELLDRGPSTGEPAANATGNALVESMREALAESPLVSLPTGERVPLTSCVVPPLVDDPHTGALFRELLPDAATHCDRSFPVAPLCAGRAAHVIVDHGATELRQPRLPGYSRSTTSPGSDSWTTRAAWSTSTLSYEPSSSLWSRLAPGNSHRVRRSRPRSSAVPDRRGRSRRSRSSRR